MKTKNYNLTIWQRANRAKRQIFLGFILFSKEVKRLVKRFTRRRTSIRVLLASTSREESLAIIAGLMR